MILRRNEPTREPLRELLIDRALGALDAAGEAELERLLFACAGDPELASEVESYELAAAAAHLALLPAPLAPLPDALRRRVADSASSYVRRQDDPH